MYRSSRGPYYFSFSSTIATSKAIGPGCSLLNNCSGHGYCDYCNAKCVCTDGFGSPQDIIANTKSVPNDFPFDCSGRVCPFGISFSAPPLLSGENTSTVLANSMHRSSECSGSGLCDRTFGLCKCFEGFTGRACERKTCLGKPTCSGNGRCLPVQYLSRSSDALPLRGNASAYTVDAGGTAATWDANKLVGCVCDSSWSVGLEAGQTQQPEYFGPTCNFRHCPTGDDPSTSVDETDCYNKTTLPGGGLGLLGNKCHVDCSNRGICNFATGACNCFPGYGGSNCGILLQS